MRDQRYGWLVAGVLAMLVMGAQACGPDFGTTLFVLPERPDNLTMFLDGRLAILQPQFHTRHLVAAYRYLNGVPLTAAEKVAFTAANAHFVDPASDGHDPYSDKPMAGVAAWMTARAAVGPVDGYVPAGQMETEKNAPGAEYSAFANCLEPAFQTAAATLQQRVKEHGAKDAGVTEWVRGQDAVFSNCGDGKAAAYFGTGKPPAPPPAPHLPKELAASVPLWLRQDRAYQRAAGQFYAMQFDAALAGFRAVAADTGSVWAATARYMEARVLIRESTLEAIPPLGGGDGTPMTAAQQAAWNGKAEVAHKAAEAKAAGYLQQAQMELMAMRGEARMAGMREATDDLQDYVAIRLDPKQDEQRLAARLLTPGGTRVKQSLIDFTVLHTSVDEGNYVAAITEGMGAGEKQQTQIPDGSGKAKDGSGAGGSRGSGAEKRILRDAQDDKGAAADMIAWVEVLNSAERVLYDGSQAGDPQAADKAFAHWQAKPSTAWLAAALMLTAKPDAHTAALLAAAKAVKASDPAYLTVAYHRLRLMANDGKEAATTRAELLPLLAAAGRGMGLSAVNQLKTVAGTTAPTLEDWLATAGRVPAGETGEGSYDETAYELPKEDVCGRPAVGFALFDTDAAVVLNRRMPLRLLATAAESKTLPENLRFQVAQATWARAVMLNEPEIAKRMSPLLEACRAAWKPVLDAYDAAQTPNDRGALGLLALMRFASTEPSVREGDERRQGFATYDSLRQNWWCSTVPRAGETVDAEPAAWTAELDPGDLSARMKLAHPDPAPPAFLTADDLAEGAFQVKVLASFPNASSYFAKQALFWMKLHPEDARTPEILGEADRVLRNSCRHDQEYGKKAGPENTATLAHAVFDALHQRYPESVWAKKYKTWE